MMHRSESSPKERVLIDLKRETAYVTYKLRRGHNKILDVDRDDPNPSAFLLRGFWEKGKSEEVSSKQPKTTCLVPRNQ